jgi:NTP pyrophosphatase (non-canonical NTP hydrolase)
VGLKQIDENRQKEKMRTFSWEKAQKKGVVLSKNQQIAEELGTSITKVEPIEPAKFEKVREEVRDRLFSVSSEDYVGNEL